jgi:tRNA-Thr(GGU) m(6)t(6)A37 methyltransferase TsaA
MTPIVYQPLGVIHSPFTETAGMPIQSVAAQGVAGWVELAPDFGEGLTDIDGFSHLWLIYHLHKIEGASLTVTPFLDNQPHGIFATRSPRRPNPIGLSVVRLVRREGLVLYIEDVDILDGTPLLDIKPYVPTFDVRQTDAIGWFTNNINRVQTTRADTRFSPPGQGDKL